MNQIQIHNEQTAFPLTEELRTIICRAVNTSVRHFDLPYPCTVSVTVTDAPHIQLLNARFRDQNRATDVLSFPMLDFSQEGVVTPSPADFEGTHLVLGDVVISLEQAARQAEEYGHSLSREVGFLTVHSMLHLLGFDHMEEADGDRMRAKEKEILAEMGLPRT